MKKSILSIAIVLVVMLIGGRIDAQNTAARMLEKGIVLPVVPQPVGNYVLFKRVGNLVYINQVALVDGKILVPGAIGKRVSEQEAKEATVQTMLNIISILNQAVGGNLDKVKQAVQITGIFNTTFGYTQHANLMNPGSALLIDIFEDRGLHTRATLGASSLPLDSPVEIQAIFEVE